MIKVSVAATIDEPVSLEEVKDYLRIDTTAEDLALAVYIAAARDQCERRIKRLLRPGTVTLTLDDFDKTELPRPPLRNSSALTVQYIDSTGGVSLVDSSVYEIHDDGDGPAVLTTAYGQSWPSCRDVRGAVTISYSAGYTTSSSGTPCPDPIKVWISMMVGSLYENREAHVIGQSASMELPFLDGLLEPYIVHSVM